MKGLALLGAAAAALLIGGGAMAADTVLRIGTIAPASSPHAKAVDKLAEVANGAKVGLDIKVFHASQLGAAQAQVQNIKLGVQDGLVEALDWFAVFSQDLRIVTAPFLFSDRAHFEKWVRSEGFNKIQQEIITKGSQRLIITDTLWRRGPYRVMMATRPVLTLADVEKVKLRLWDNETITRFWGKRGLGANTVNIAWGEVYLALRQGTVDAVTSPFDLVPGMKFVEVAPNIMPIDEFPQILALSLNDAKWRSLTDAQRAAIVAGVEQGGQQFNAEVNASLEEWKKQLVAAGGKFHDFDRGPFIAKVAELNAQWQKEGYWRAGFLEDIQKVK